MTMKSAEEILKPYVETPFRHTQVVEKDNALLAMQKYADQFRVTSDAGNSAPLTEEFVEQLGFRFIERVDEPERGFYWIKYENNHMSIFFNYQYDQSEVTYDVDFFEGYELQNIGTTELVFLVNFFNKHLV